MVVVLQQKKTEERRVRNCCVVPAAAFFVVLPRSAGLHDRSTVGRLPHRKLQNKPRHQWAMRSGLAASIYPEGASPPVSKNQYASRGQPLRWSAYIIIPLTGFGCIVWGKGWPSRLPQRLEAERSADKEDLADALRVIVKHDPDKELDER